MFVVHMDSTDYTAVYYAEYDPTIKSRFGSEPGQTHLRFDYLAITISNLVHV